MRLYLIVEVDWLQLFALWQNPMTVVLTACCNGSAVFLPLWSSCSLSGSEADSIDSLLETTTVAVLGDVALLPLVPGMPLSVSLLSTPVQLFCKTIQLFLAPLFPLPIIPNNIMLA